MGPVVLSGCSGGGKSTVLRELRRWGFATVDEPGRRIVRQQQRDGGVALPWVDASAFARLCIDVARADLDGAAAGRWVFFDRGLVDAAVALHHHSGHLGCSDRELRRYHPRVFLVPPWPELHANDAERQLPFGEAVEEYDRLVTAYQELGYTVTVLPMADVASRVDVILDHLGLVRPMETP